jgi:hypothetical protein
MIMQVAESFFQLLKQEQIGRTYLTRSALRTAGRVRLSRCLQPTRKRAYQRGMLS